MPTPKQRPSAGHARLSVLAAADTAKFRAYALELLASKQRLDREAALEALHDNPDAGARDPLRALYFHLDEDGMKRDHGGTQRLLIAKILRTLGDSRDSDIAIRASDTRELIFGDDSTWSLRAHGLMMLAELAPDVFPYYAIEHLDDVTLGETEPAGTAFQLLAATENFLPIYQWLRGAGQEASHMPRIFELFASGPPAIVLRFVEQAAETALRREDEALCTVLAEAIVQHEMESAYPALANMMSAKISAELHAYLAMLLAATNRPPLLAILEEQLRRRVRARPILDALAVRATPEQQAILDRWERDGG